MHHHNDTPETTPHDSHDQRRGHRGPRGHRPIDPDASEIELIQHLARHLRRGSAVETAPWGLSPHQARALGVIARSEGRGRGWRGRRGRGFEEAGSEAGLEQSGGDASPAQDQRTTAGTTGGSAQVPESEAAGLRLGALAGWLQIAPRSATEVVDALEAQGLVARTPDPADRRAVLVGLTDQGRQVATEIRAARRAATETLLDELSSGDRAQLRTSLLTLLEAAARSHPSEDPRPE